MPFTSESQRNFGLSPFTRITPSSGHSPRIRSGVLGSGHSPRSRSGIVASQATHLGVIHLGAAAGLRAQATHLVLAAHIELSHPPRRRSRTSGSGHSLRSRSRTSGSGHSPRSRWRFWAQTTHLGLPAELWAQAFTTEPQRTSGSGHSPRITRMANSCRSPQSRSGLGLRPFTSDSQRNAELRSFTSDSQHFRPIDGQPRYGRKRCPPQGHTALVCTKVVAPHSSHEGRRRHFRPREGRRQRFRPIDGQPRYRRKRFPP